MVGTGDLLQSADIEHESAMPYSVSAPSGSRHQYTRPALGSHRSSFRNPLDYRKRPNSKWIRSQDYFRIAGQLGVGDYATAERGSTLDIRTDFTYPVSEIWRNQLASSNRSS